MARSDTLPAKQCANCGAELLGEFCHRCGQAAHTHRSLAHLLHESLHHLLHFETRGWHTLPLLVVRPGLITRRYIQGQRTRYLAPFPLFLFSVFLLFLVYSLPGSNHVIVRGDAAAARAELKREIDQDRAQIERERSAGGSAHTDDPEVGADRLDLAAAQAALNQVDRGLTTEKSRGAAPSPAHGPTTTGEITVHTGWPLLDRRLNAQLANPDLLRYKLSSAASKLAFVLVPISLPFLWLMFLGRPEITLYDHAVFSLYSLSFMSMLFVAAALLGVIGLGAVVAPLVMFIPPLHMFMQLRETYQLKVWAALWRTAALLCVAGSAFVLFLMLIVVTAIH